MFQIPCQPGYLQLTDDGFIQVVSQFQVNWREPIQAIRSIDVKPTMTSVDIVIRASRGYFVPAIARENFDQLRSLLPPISVVEVSQLIENPQPLPPTQPPAYYPPQQPYFQQPMPHPPQQPMYPPQYQQPPQMETTVKRYKNAQDYQRDLKKMQRQGWQVQNTLDHHKDRSMAYKMFVPFGAFSGGTGEIVVTYQRPMRR